ncbi:MAG TPA: NAD(P)H-dependent oxidoreductase [Chthoniobacterales bacterium]
MIGFSRSVDFYLQFVNPTMSYVLALSGSPNKFSKTTSLLHTIARQLGIQGCELRAVHATDFGRSFTGHLIRVYLSDFGELVRQADVIVLLTPIGNDDHPGLLAPLLELLPDGAFAEKPVLLVVTGGLPAHVAGLEQASAAELNRLQGTLLQPPLHIGSRSWIVLGDDPPQLTRGTEGRLASALKNALSPRSALKGASA